ncbi:hypothetical protein IFE17_04505 [Actinobacillus sp. GY-402]|nr:hypothetical protein IFE17_04440 [Actinobacillus sp. GY-402]QOF68917.1 hypothetical protein IFE17_04505 [Actinobacillus sp. GY-402]
MGNLCSGDTCNQVVLNLSQSEAFKLYQSVESLKSESVDYSQYSEFFAFSFGTTLSFWLLSRVIGVALNLIKRT